MKTRFLTYVAALGIISGCEGMLDKYPLAQMSPETFFSTENELEAFSNTFYTVFPSTSIYSESVDNYTQLELPEELRGARIIPASGSGWTWDALRNYNTLLENSVNCPDLDVRSEYNALARFFRAYFYFEKVKRFGDVPWYDTQLGSDDPALYKPRDSREYVMQKMIEDIDYAIGNLPAERSLYRITRWTALALKSRFCLFEGTFRKYHDVTYPEHDWQWYLQQAASAAEEFILNSGYTIYKADGPDKSYLNLFASENAIPDEIILARDYNEGLGVTHNANFYTLGQSHGRPGMTRKIVASYLMSDGSRFDMDSVYNVAMTSYRASGGGGILAAAGVDTDNIDDRVTGRYPEIRNILYDYITAHGSIDPDVIGDEKTVGKWSFIPEKMASEMMRRDMKLLFE